MELIYQHTKLLVQTILSLFKVLIKSNFFLEKYKTQEKSLYILGNGPSFNNNLSDYKQVIKTKNLMCVNGFPLTEAFLELKPKYYIICSPGFYNNEAVDYNVNIRKKIINSLVEKTEWPLIFFLPKEARQNQDFIKNIKGNKNIKIYFFNKTAVEAYSGIRNILYSKGIASPRPHNVMISAILQSITIGYKNIYLLGADHSWLPQITVNKENQVLINQKHFYDENESKAKQMHKDEGKNNIKLHEVLDKFKISFQSYHELDKFSKTKNAQIKNLTKDSFIDAFQKIDIKEHFG